MKYINKSIKVITIVICLTLYWGYTQIDSLQSSVSNNITETPIPNKAEPQSDNSSQSNKPNGRIPKIEMPGKLQGIPERIVEHMGYTVSFNKEHNNPNYVAWDLTSDETDGNIPRNNDFDPDPEIPKPHQVTTNDYKGSGYNRGHMVPAADMKWSQQAMHECFYMSNICPQNNSLNSGSWQTLEDACRRWAQQEGCIYIVCGPVYKKGSKHKTIGKEHRITVPEGFFKVVLSLKKGEEKAIGFYYANAKNKQPMEERAMSVNAVEEMTGFDFFVNINDKLEDQLEASYSLKKWK